jgi:aconitate hydratase
LDSSGSPVFLTDIWPTRQELQEIERQYVLPAMFKETYSTITEGNRNWNSLEVSESLLYPWDSKSTYIKSPPFFESMMLEIPTMQSINDAQVLLNLGDSVTTGE